MKPVDRRKVESSLQAKGFKKNQADHKKFVYYTREDKKTSVWTKISRGGSHSEISPNNLSKMAKQCRLKNSDFEELVKCPLERDEYEQLLVEQEDIVLH